jgi:hypothetical protein
MSPVGRTFWMGYRCENIWRLGVRQGEQPDIPIWGKPKDMYRSHFVFRTDFLWLWDSYGSLGHVLDDHVFWWNM